MKPNKINANMEQYIKDIAQTLGTVDNIKKLEKIFAPVLDVEEMWQEDERLSEFSDVTDIENFEALPKEHLAFLYTSKRHARRSILSVITEIARELDKIKNPKKEVKNVLKGLK